MALIKEILERQPERTSVHKLTEATFHTFEKNGDVFLQIDTYGSEDRKMAAKISQSMQFGPDGIAELRRLLRLLP